MKADADEILLLQKLAYKSEADLYEDDQIEPLVQTLEQLQSQFEDHVVLKAVLNNVIIGSARAKLQDNTCYIGKLMVHPNHQNQGLGRRLMHAIEEFFPNTRYELFTGSRSVKNLALYESLGYRSFREKMITEDFSLIFLEK